MLGKILALLFENKFNDKSSGDSGRSVSPEEFNKYRQDVDAKLESAKKDISNFKKIAAGLLIVFTFFGWTTWNGLKNAKKNIETQVENEIALTKDRVRLRLDEEFRSDNIKKLVSAAAEEYTRTEARSLINQEVKLKTGPLLDDTNKRLASLSRLYSLEIRARADSREAFEEIKSMTNDANEEIRGDALTVLTIIRKQYSVLRQRQGIILGGVAATKSDGKVYSYTELEPKDQVALLGDPNASFETIHKMRSQISNKADLDPYLLGLLKKTDSLAASVAATSILSERTGKTDLDIFDFAGWIGYLEKVKT